MEISNIHTFSARERTTDREPENCRLLQTIGDALAIFDAIGQGGLLAAMPEDEADRARYQTGMTLLDLMERRLREAVGNPERPISSECGCNGKHCSP